jgi:hypothetical protein
MSESLETTKPVELPDSVTVMCIDQGQATPQDQAWFRSSKTTFPIVYSADPKKESFPHITVVSNGADSLKFHTTYWLIPTGKNSGPQVKINYTLYRNEGKPKLVYQGLNFGDFGSNTKFVSDFVGSLRSVKTNPVHSAAYSFASVLMGGDLPFSCSAEAPDGVSQ